MVANRWLMVALMMGACLFQRSVVFAQDPFDPLGESDAHGAVFDPAAAAAEALAKEEPILAPVADDEANAGRDDFCRCVGESDADAAHRIEDALRGQLKSHGLEFADTPLEEVVNLLEQEYGIPIEFDVKALEAIGLAPTEPVNVSLHNISLRSALQLLLKPLQLTYVVQNEVLMITTPEEAESRLRTCVYNVRPLIDDTSEESMDGLIDTIVSCVATKSWAENGAGEAEIRVPTPGLLVISQTQAVHDEIDGLLTAISKLRKQNGDGQADAGDGKERVSTRSYVLQVGEQGGNEKLQTRVRELITQAVPDAQWDGQLPNGQPVLLAVLGDRVIVRHTPAVQEAIESLLVDSGVALPASDDEGSDRRGRSGRRKSGVAPSTSGGVGGGGAGGGFFGGGGAGAGGFGAPHAVPGE